MAKNFFDETKLPAGEKKFHDKMKQVIEGLLFDLNNEYLFVKKGRVETAQVITIMQDKEETSKNFNALNQIFENTNKLKDFLNKTKDFFDDSRFSHIYFSQLCLLFLNYTELFKDFLLFYLDCGKNSPFSKKMTLYPFFDALEKCSPVHGKKLRANFNITLRNALSHGLFHLQKIEGEVKICYYPSIEDLDKPIFITLADFFFQMKNNNLLFLILTKTFADLKIHNKILLW